MAKVGHSKFSHCPLFVQTQPLYVPAAAPCSAHCEAQLWDPDLPPHINVGSVQTE